MKKERLQGALFVFKKRLKMRRGVGLGMSFLILLMITSFNPETQDY